MAIPSRIKKSPCIWPVSYIKRIFEDILWPGAFRGSNSFPCNKIQKQTDQGCFTHLSHFPSMKSGRTEYIMGKE